MPLAVLFNNFTHCNLDQQKFNKNTIALESRIPGNPIRFPKKTAKGI